MDSIWLPMLLLKGYYTAGQARTVRTRVGVSGEALGLRDRHYMFIDATLLEHLHV